MIDFLKNAGINNDVLVEMIKNNDETAIFDERIRGFPVGVRAQEADDEFCSFTFEWRKDRVIFEKHPNRPWP